VSYRSSRASVPPSLAGPVWHQMYAVFGTYRDELKAHSCSGTCFSMGRDTPTVMADAQAQNLWMRVSRVSRLDLKGKYGQTPVIDLIRAYEERLRNQHGGRLPDTPDPPPF
jgi:hypothetical protein